LFVWSGETPLTLGYVERVGTFSGRHTFDLYFGAGVGQEPGTRFTVDVEARAGGKVYRLDAECTRP
jgi:hypothetical protein